MRYLKLYNESVKPGFRKYVEETCSNLCITRWSINDEGKVDVDDSVHLRNCDLTKIPFKFGNVTGHFTCNGNNFKTLKGSPDYVGGYFSCNSNQLISLDGAPTKVGEYFSCSSNKLVNLIGGPKELNGDYYCDWNELVSLEGAPEYLDYDLDCSNNKLETLSGMPIGLRFIDCASNNIASTEGIKKSKLFRFQDNPIYVIYRLFCSYDRSYYQSASDFMDSLDYNYIRGNSIVKSRFSEVCDEYGIKMPNELYHYSWI